MTNRILGMRTPNWTALTNSRVSKTSKRLDRGEYEWQIVLFDKTGKRKDDLNIWADSFDEAVKKAQTLIDWGESVTVDGTRFTK